MRIALTTVAVVGLLLASCPRAYAQDNSNLQRKLDRPVEFSVKDMQIGDLFAKLGDKTGVKFVLDEDTLNRVSYGKENRLTMKIGGQRLRDCLTPMLAPQALTWSIDGETVRISPSEPLFRMGRMATFEEQQTLGSLCRADKEHLLTAPRATTSPAAGMLAQLRTITDEKDLNITFKTSQDKKDAAFESAMKALPCNGAAFLDALCAGHDWTWYLADHDDIVILDRKKQIERQLNNPVTLKYENAQIQTVLMDLAHAGRIQMAFDEGVLLLLPPETRTNFTFSMPEGTIAQALDTISGATGLVFTRTGEGVKVTASRRIAEGGSTSQPRGRASFLVKMTVAGAKGTSYEVYIRSDELPDDVRAVIEEEKAKLIEKMRADLVKEGTTKPASEPKFETDVK